MVFHTFSPGPVAGVVPPGCPCSVYTRQRTKAVSCSTPITLATRLSGNRYVRAMATRLPGNSFAPSASETFLGDGSHLADDIVVAFAFYNVGIQNTELLSANWPKRSASSKKVKLKIDIDATFCADVGVQALFISEFGEMYKEATASVTKDFC